MKESKILSIIVPSYNMEKYLKRGLLSLVVQKEQLSKLEVIVVNDGSKDSTLLIAQEFEKTYPGVFITIDKKNGNYGSCINAGLKIANGIFVKILDADDSFITSNFEKAIDVLIESEEKKENIDLFFFDWKYVDEQGATTKELSFNIPKNEAIEIKSDLDSIYFKDIQHHAIAYRTDFLRKQNYSQTEGVSYTDTEWIYKPLLFVKRIKYCPIQVYSYLYGRADQSMSPSQVARGFNSMLAVEKSLVLTYTLKKGTVNPINEKIYREKLISNIEYFYSKYLVIYTNKETSLVLFEFDNYLKENCYDLYCAISGFTISKLKIKYVKAFRKKPYGIRHKTVITLFKLKNFFRKNK